MANKITDRDLRDIPLNKICISDENVRKELINDGLEELKNSIKKFGLIFPVIVIEKKKDSTDYELVVGQRRYYAFEGLNEKTIPAIVVNSLDKESREIVSFAENLHRRDLSYGDTIRVCENLFNSYKGSKKEKIDLIAKNIGISPSTVSKYLGYLLIPTEVRNLVEGKKITRDQAHKITTAFWPNTTKIVKIAKLMEGKPKPEWERALDVGRRDPNITAKKIVEEAKKPSTKIKLTLELEGVQLESLRNIAKKRQSQEQREIEIIEIIKEAIEKYLKVQ